MIDDPRELSRRSKSRVSGRLQYTALQAIHHLKVEGDAGYTIITMPRGMTIDFLHNLFSGHGQGHGEEVMQEV